MSASVRHLPVLQNWDCHATGTCCKEYQVTLSDEERRRIEEQGWDASADLDGRSPFVRRGPPWKRRYQLNRRPDGSCVFLSEQGRCRIHERFGYEAKPLPCRLFPFVLIPVGDHWRVSVRFACPSAAASKGRPLAEHDDALKQFAAELAQREGLGTSPDGSLVPPPRLQSGQRVGWSDLLRFVSALQALLRNPNDRMERRLRKCLALARECRRARFDKVTGGRLNEFLNLIGTSLEAEVPRDPAALPPASWVGHVLFRQALALFLRKDQGPNRGLAARGRAALLAAALQFARGTGPVPRLHAWLPETTFERIEAATGPLSGEAEQVLERYYAIKVGSLQFCGPAYFGLPFWDGLEALLVTYPVILWTARAFHDLPRAEAVTRALCIVDDHFGFNRVLASHRQRLSFRLLASLKELERLIAWYSR